MKNYKTRVIDQILSYKLEGVGAILVEGPKWCGKTTTCTQVAKSVLSIGDPMVRERYIQLAETSTDELLEGKRPRLIDEWQDIPLLWDAVRFKVDQLNGYGHFILTGSSVPADTSKIFHSGAGRFAKLRMYPMTLWESEESTGVVSMKALLNGEDFKLGKAMDFSLHNVAHIICRGGWPEAVSQRGDISLDKARDYYEVVTESDIARADGISKDPWRVKQLMRSYARLQGTQSNLSVIRKDMLSNESSDLNEKTIKSYIDALKKIFVIEDVPAWCPCLRSKSAIRTSDTRYFVDPSITAAALGFSPANLFNDLTTMGYAFETMAIRDLRVYAASLRGHVSHFLDRHGLECDAIVHLDHGEYGLIEMKLGGETLIEGGANTLKTLASLIDTDRMKPPSFMMVLTAVGEYAYKRKDGIIVCPLSALRP